jgi:hypothetical protein
MGGSAAGYPEPTFSGGGGIGAANNTDDFAGGGSTLASSASTGATTLTTTTAVPSYPTKVIFADGTSYAISGHSGTSITLSSGLTTAESAGTGLWAAGNPIAYLPGGAAQGATTIQTGAMSVPLLPLEFIDIGADNGVVDYLQVSQVSGSESSGYTLTLAQPVNIAAAANAPLYYGGPASDVTVEYLTIENGGGNTVFDLQGGGNSKASGWTIEYNDIENDYSGGAASQSTDASGVGVYGGDNSTIDYNCFEQMGQYAINAFGSNVVFDYNEVLDTPYQPDLDGNGDTGCGKWWATSNSDVVDNAFIDSPHSGTCVWFDNGNTGQLVEGNYLDNISGTAVSNETGWNSEYIGNLFQDIGGISLNMNDSGGWDIPGSRYNNSVLISGNTFYNVATAVDIWGASGRSCLNSGEASGSESDAYCSGGFPQMPPTEQYFSHYFDSNLGPLATIADNENCSSSSPCSTVTLSNAPTNNDWVGFSSPVQTTSPDGTNVTTLNGTSVDVLNVSSVSGFAASGQLLVDTTAGALYTATGAVLSYTATSTGPGCASGDQCFTGVNYVAGAGDIGTTSDAGTPSGTVEAVQPYHVTGVSCPGGNCTDNAVATISPAITSNLGAGTGVYATGTCPYYDTASATPSSPMASNGSSYYDGCMWEDRNISVTDNTFYIDASQFNSTAYPWGGTWGQAINCNTGAGNNCGQNDMGFQYPGGDAAPYSNPALSNAMMSDSALPAPYNNLNASGSPLAKGKSADARVNAAAPYDDLWSANTYQGDWTFQAYVQAGGCPLGWTGSSLTWVGGAGGNACSGLSLSQWQQYWGQD